MSLICSTACGAAATLPANYFNCLDNFRKFGAKYFALMKCTWVPTDVESAAEWGTAKTAGNVMLSPPGALVQQAPTAEAFIVDGCGREVVGEVTYLFDFETHQTKDDLTDCDTWNDFFKNSAAYRIVFVDCEGNWTLSDAYTAAIKAGASTVAGNSPGFEFSVTVVPHQVAGNGGYAKWVTQIKVKTTGVLCQSLLPGVLAAIQ